MGGQKDHWEWGPKDLHDRFDRSREEFQNRFDKSREDLQRHVSKPIWEHRYLFAIFVFIVLVFVQIFSYLAVVFPIEDPIAVNTLILALSVFLSLQLFAFRADAIEDAATSRFSELDESMSDVSDSINELARSLDSTIEVAEHSSTTMDSQTEETNVLLRKIIEERNVDEIKMLEYSSGTVGPIISKAVKEKCEIRLLLKHPLSVDVGIQCERIENQLREYHKAYRDYDKLNIKFYKENASLRGRLIDREVINVGWYTFDHRNEVDCQI